MGRIDSRTRTGLIVGALAMFLALDVAFLISLIGLPFTPFALGQAIIDVLPGSISIPLIETLEFWAKGLLVIGVVALFFVGGAIAGALAVSPRRSNAAVIATVAAPWAIAVALGALVAGQRIDFGTSLIDGSVGVAVNALALAFLAPASLDRSAAPSPDRRRVLLGGAGVAVLAALAGLPLSRALALAGAQTRRPSRGARASDPGEDAHPCRSRQSTRSPASRRGSPRPRITTPSTRRS